VSTSNTHKDFNTDELWMQRCLDLAINGLGNVAPNPLVGCVIVHENKVIGEAYHVGFSLEHAEVNAINAVKDKSLLSKSTLYVNLEPCSHHGKTPPCSDLIILHKLKKVVVGALDSNEIVNGLGVEMLKEAGIEVVVNVLKKECLVLNKRFYTFHEKKRPHYILKWAETSDGYIYDNDQNKAISNKLSQQKVHQIRSEEQALLIGKNTLITDNPLLNTRLVKGKNPLRIIVMGEMINSIRQQKIFKDGAPTLIFNTSIAAKENQVEFIKYGKGEFMSKLNDVLYQRGILSVLVEGGTTTLNAFIKSNNWDEAYKIVAQHSFSKGVIAPEISTPISSEYKVGEGDKQDNWFKYLNQNNKSA
jgi:diaminohydroxyphosphoribosylaminopyrimidine deaminase/5-amino-6-(5-phosphoribosylamino)uracil reductase